MEYRPFLEPMPAYEEGWFQYYGFDDPLPVAGVLAIAAVGIPLGGWLATAIVVGLGVLFFGWGFWAVMSMIWTILVVVGILCALAAVGLLVYRIAVLPSLRQQNLAQSDQAMGPHGRSGGQRMSRRGSSASAGLSNQTAPQWLLASSLR